MDQQNQGSSNPSSNVPMKRKRGRPRKEERAVHVVSMQKSDNVLNSSNQIVDATTDNCDEDMVGKAVTGVVEGTFKAGYLLNVKVDETDSPLRGVVFLPGQVNPVTPENDLAPHVKMIKRKEFPVPRLKTQTEALGSVPSSVQCSKQSSESEIQVPMSVEQVLPTEIHSLENQSASTLIPVADLPKNETTSISSGGIPQGISEPEHVSQPTSIGMKELERDKIVKQGDKLHELDVSTQVKESCVYLPKNETTTISSGGIPTGISEPEHVSQPASIMIEPECDKTVKHGDTLHELDDSTQVKDSRAEGGATRDSRPASEPINIVPTIENTDKELRTEQGDTLHELDASIQVKESSADGDGGATRDSRPESEPINIVSTIENTDKEELRTEQGDTLHELDASTQVKESSADGDGGATRDSRPASEPINIVPTIENTDKEELRTEQQAVPSVHQLNELVHEEPNSSNIELNPIPVSDVPESMQSEDSEQTSKSVGNFVEKQDLPDLPKTDLLDDSKNLE